jgi:hypothetical protein
MTPAQALAALVATKNNEMALADPTIVLWEAELAFKQAVVDALEANSAQSIAVSTSSVSSSPAPVEDNSAAITALQAENAALVDKVAAGERALQAFDAILHPQAPAPAVENSTSDAAPSSTEPPTITPTAP